MHCDIQFSRGEIMTFNPPIVSALTCGVLIIMQMAFLLTVALARQSNRQSLGDGGHPSLLNAMRRHGNLAENAAIFIAGFALLEILGASRISVEIFCGLFVLVRISHAIGLSMKSTVNRFRFIGAAGTAFIGFALGVRLIIASLYLL
jgi:uncharacterized protein